MPQWTGLHTSWQLLGALLAHPQGQRIKPLQFIEGTGLAA